MKKLSHTIEKDYVNSEPVILKSFTKAPCLPTLRHGNAAIPELVDDLFFGVLSCFHESSSVF